MDIKEAGRKGGSKTSERKAQAARENGKKGGRPASEIIWSSKMTMCRADYPTEYAYRRMFQAAKAHYGYMFKVDGGWIFFETATDAETWQRQK